MYHLEPFIDQAVESLRTGVADRIAQVNAETVDFDLEVPDDDAYIPGGVDAVVKVPLIEVAAPDWDIANPSLGQHSWDADYTLMVRCWYQHPEFNKLYRSLMRYGRVLVEVLMQPDALGSGVVINRMRGAYRVNPEVNDLMGFEGGALVVCSFEAIEIAP